MLYFIFAALIVVIDQLFKAWIAATIVPGTSLPLIPKILHLTYVENTGAAFSILSDARWLLVALSSVSVVAIIVILLRVKLPRLVKWCAAAILGGAAGNLIDRVRTGAVIDMFEARFINFAIFNVADIFITLGCGALIVYYIAEEIRERKSKAVAAAPENVAAQSPNTSDDDET